MTGGEMDDQQRQATERIEAELAAAGVPPRPNYAEQAARSPRHQNYSAAGRFDLKSLLACPDCGGPKYTCPCAVQRRGGEEEIAAREAAWKEEERLMAEGQRRARIRRNREASGIFGVLAGCAFENFDRTRPGNSGEICAEVEAWARSATRHTQQGWALYSPGYGVGKTHLAIAAANVILSNGGTVRFTTMAKLLDAMRSEFRGRDGSVVGSALKSAIECNLLVIDDFGAERIAPDEAGDWTRQQIYTLFDDRMNWGRPVIVTTNLAPPDIEAKIGGEGHGGRIVSRLLKMARWVEMDGPDARTGA